jgi:hypothetical protein
MKRVTASWGRWGMKMKRTSGGRKIGMNRRRRLGMKRVVKVMRVRKRLNTERIRIPSCQIGILYIVLGIRYEEKEVEVSDNRSMGTVVVRSIWLSWWMITQMMINSKVRVMMMAACLVGLGWPTDLGIWLDWEG